MKLFLKIIGIPYISEATNTQISSDKIDKIMKNNHIFNDIVLVSKPRVIKVSPKSNMSIVLINIWNTQNSVKAKSLINRRFNIRSFITTICDANMNLGIP